MLYLYLYSLNFGRNQKTKMKKIIDITKENEELLKKDGTFVVDFWAEWCSPCRTMSPILQEFAEKYENIPVYKVNIDDNQELATKHNIRAIPTIIIFKDKIIHKQKVGIVNVEKLEEYINE